MVRQQDALLFCLPDFFVMPIGKHAEEHFHGGEEILTASAFIYHP
jgi:hypothetical protein